MRIVWQEPIVGPFRKWDGDSISAHQQNVLNRVVRPLLRDYEEKLQQVDEHPNSFDHQLAAALKTNILTRIIEQANLTADSSKKAVKLLNRRLEQLLHDRGHVDPKDR